MRVSSKVQVSVGNIQKLPRLPHETGFNMGLRMYCQKSSWDMTMCKREELDREFAILDPVM